MSTCAISSVSMTRSAMDKLHWTPLAMRWAMQRSEDSDPWDRNRLLPLHHRRMKLHPSEPLLTKGSGNCRLRSTFAHRFRPVLDRSRSFSFREHCRYHPSGSPTSWATPCFASMNATRPNHALRRTRRGHRLKSLRPVRPVRRVAELSSLGGVTHPRQ